MKKYNKTLTELSEEINISYSVLQDVLLKFWEDLKGHRRDGGEDWLLDDYASAFLSDKIKELYPDEYFLCVDTVHLTGSEVKISKEAFDTLFKGYSEEVKKNHEMYENLFRVEDVSINTVLVDGYKINSIVFEDKGAKITLYRKTFCGFENED